MSARLSLEDLCIYNLLGTERLEEGLSSHGTLHEDLSKKILPILATFKECMKSQDVFLETVENNPLLALFIMKKRLRKISYYSNNEETICRAAKSGSVELVRYLIERQGPDANNKYVIYWAVRSGNLELVRYLFERPGADAYAISRFTGVFLRHAAESGNLELVRYLFERLGAVADRFIVQNEEALLWSAVQRGDFDLERYIYERVDAHSVRLNEGTDANSVRLNEGRVCKHNTMCIQITLTALFALALAYAIDTSLK